MSCRLLSRIAFSILVVCAPAARAESSPPDAVEIPIDERALRAAGISFSPLERERGAAELTFPGTVVVPPLQLRVIAAPVDGLIESIEVAPDEVVAEDQPLLRLRSPALVELQRDFISADADAGLARDWLRRAEQLSSARALPERELRQAENQARTTAYRAAERRHALRLMGMAEAEIEALQRTREFKPIIAIAAPSAGVVLQQHASAGARVAAAGPLFTVARLAPLWVNIQVPESRVNSLVVGASVFLPAHGSSGHLIRIGRSVDTATQSVTAVAEIEAARGTVRPGLAVTATVKVEQNGVAQWVVPSGAVVRHSDRTWIFLKKADGVQAQSVEVLGENAQDASIRAALAPQDQVATRGVIALLAELAKADTE